MKRQMKWLVFLLLLVYFVTLCGCGLVKTTKYTLTIDVDGEGEVTPASGSKFKKGTVVTLTATPHEGWEFKEWNGPDGKEVTENKITMNDNKTIIAKFVQKEDDSGNGDEPGEPGNGGDEPGEPGNGDQPDPEEKYTLIIWVEGEGEVLPASGSEYKKGTVVELTVIPQEGWEFVEWAGENGPEVKENEIIMDENKELIAIFKETTPIFDDYYGFTDNAHRLYNLVVDVEIEGEKVFYYGTVEMIYEVIIDDPDDITVIKETAREIICIDDEEKTSEYLNYIGKKKVNDGYKYYSLTTEDEETEERSYDLDHANNDGYIMYVAPLKVGEQNPMGKVEAYEDVWVDVRSYKAYRVVIQDDENFRSTIWVVPHLGIIKNLQERKESGVTLTMELVSY